MPGMAVVISLMAAAFTGWQAWEAHNARLDAKEAAEKARDNAKEAADKQLEDVKAARKAAEDSLRAARELATGMNRSAKAAEASAEAGRESALMSKLSLQLSERPTLESLDAKLSPPLAAGVALLITVDTYNSGKGPAYNVNVRQSVSLESTCTFKFSDQIAEQHADVIGAGRSKLTTMSYVRAVTQSEFDDIVNGRKKLFVYGSVSFEERATPQSTAQAYMYCYYYNPADADKTRFLLCPGTPPIPTIGIPPRQ
jgi:hypothetical protein